MPLLGIVFLPYTTVMYMITWSAGGIEGWDWMWIVLGVFLDLAHWGEVVDEAQAGPGLQGLLALEAPGWGDACSGRSA